MATNILMPALSPTMTEGTLARWLKKEGEKVAAGDVIAEIETDKATMEVEAVDEGVLGKILVPDGTQNVKVNEPIAVLVEEGEAVPAGAGAGAAKAPRQEAGEVGQAPPQPAAPATAAPQPRQPEPGRAEPGYRAARRQWSGRAGADVRLAARSAHGQAGRHRSFHAARQRPERAHRQGRHRGGGQGYPPAATSGRSIRRAAV